MDNRKIPMDHCDVYCLIALDMSKQELGEGDQVEKDKSRISNRYKLDHSFSPWYIHLHWYEYIIPLWLLPAHILHFMKNIQSK